MADDALSDSENFEKNGQENNNPQGNEKEFLLLLISLYRDAPELWKVKSQFYYDKNKKALTMSRITNALKVFNPNYTNDDLKKKINIIRTNFNRELNKRKLSMRSGAGSDDIYEYVPKLWYFNEMMFLADSVDIADTEDSVDSQDVSETYCSRHTESNQKKKMKAKSRDDVQLELMSMASSYFNKPEDEDEIVAKAWAVQLKKLSETQKRYAKKIINDVLFEGEMGSLTRGGVCFLPSSPANNSSNTPNLIYSSQSEFSTSPEPKEFRIPINSRRGFRVPINSPSPNNFSLPSLPVVTESITTQNQDVSTGHQKIRVPINSPSPSSCSSSSLPVIIKSITIKNPMNLKSPSKTFAPRKTTSSCISSKIPTKNKIIVKQETKDLNQYRINQSPSHKPPKTTAMFSSSATNLSSVCQSNTMIQSLPQSYILQSTSQIEEYVQPSDLRISLTSNHRTPQSPSTLETIDYTQPGVRVKEDKELFSAADYFVNEVTIDGTQPGVHVSEDEELFSAADYFVNEVTIDGTQPGVHVSEDEELISAANYLKKYSSL